MTLERTVHAAIDIGTNSIHLVVASADVDGGFEVLTSDKESVRLGSGSGDMRELTPEAMDRGVAALQRFRQVADTYDAQIAAVATSAVREAENRDVFLRRVKDEAGLAVDVIAGTEEARLIHLGVLQTLPVFEQQILVVDIGGGSTEMIIGRAAKVLAARSVKLGHIRLTTRFFPNGIVEPGAVDACRAYVRAFLAPATRTLSELGFQVAIGASGTIATAAALIRSLEGAPTSMGLRQADIPAASLTMLVERLASFRTPAERVAGVVGLESKRADVIVAGTILLEQVFERFGVENMTYSDYALREGVLLDRVHGEEEGFHHLNNIRRASVLRFADAFEEDRSHVEHATDLALQLFDDLSELHGYSLFERDLLEAAGLLHNVGVFVSHAAHHKHSYYIIRNSDRLNGFADHEIELIAQIARYHRRSGPKETHADYMALAPEDRQRVEVLAGIERLGIALDRTRNRVVSRLEASVDPRAINVRLVVKPDGDPSLELYTARERSGLLARALERDVELEVAGEGDPATD